MTIKEFQCISMLSVILPLAAIALKWKKLDSTFRCLGIFLVWGLLNDLRHHVEALAPARPYFIAIYVLSEVLFYTWFIARVEPTLRIKDYLRYIVMILVALWLVSYGNVFIAHASQPHSGIFDVSSAIFLTFAVAYAMLQLTKYETTLHQQYAFWFFLGILIYFMCSVLIFSFIAASFRDQIWFLHGIFDISKMVLFAIGVFISNQQSETGSLLKPGL